MNKIAILNKDSEEQQKLWPIYFSLLVAEVSSVLFVPAISMSLIGARISEFLIFGMIFFICIIENVILLIVGIIRFIKQKKELKEKKIKSKNHTLVKIFLTFLCVSGSIFFIMCVPKMFKKKYIDDYVVKYMTTKYGDGNFKVINIAKEYSGGFFGETEEQSGYNVTMKTSYTDELVYVSIDGITKETFEISYDSLIYDYYKVGHFPNTTNFNNSISDKKMKKIEADYKKYFDINIDFSVVNDFDCRYEVPEDYGHVPSIDELVELSQVDTDDIIIRIYDYVEKKNELDYLKKLAKYSMSYFNTEKEINIDYTLNYNRKGFIKINNSTVTIKIDEEEKNFSKEEIQNYKN